MASPKTICVYCSSSDALDSAFFEAAEALGAEIARQGHALVYGSGKTGLMGAVTHDVQQGGGHVNGVIPEPLYDQCFDTADELVVTRDLRERKAIMEARADAFIGLTAGFGTL